MMNYFKEIWFQSVQLRRKGFVYGTYRFCFQLLSILYFIIVMMRRSLYWLHLMPSRKFPVYTISVGNITVGGTGKTPFVLYLAERLAKKGSVGIISHGYGDNKNKGKTGLSDDEAFPTPEKIIRVVASNRYTAGMQLCKVDGVKAIILDDGFQHFKLKRDIDIVLIDATNPFGSGWLLPGGTFARADLVAQAGGRFCYYPYGFNRPGKISILGCKTPEI